MVGPVDAAGMRVIVLAPGSTRVTRRRPGGAVRFLLAGRVLAARRWRVIHIARAGFRAAPDRR
ncbi:hypothetical protein CJO71_09110 [Burkholderia ubonensis]|uniref:Uncharacterized protein n=1 Tax=Burkholderia ubonensis TaxID=101571 RepID=A0AB74D260_9BURK|nr:hypothetical protein CJO71_09110 [Burkholderia ubonensis]PAJ83007.1 hypothetical protein CJO70_34895 [Burkholderia ubonensis]PAJ94578.1 hypothetical protein CJO69_10215 [Burkholderia ubonensis]PAK01626.1 hypothetical protein CJO68_08640 [Burkholderia ubonensis]RQP74212.1 hypothetical protein DF015_22920 [Burkholderia ubonensis]